MKKTALITGASSGIGLEIARQLAGEGVSLILVARRKERLEALAGELESGGAEVRVIPLDLARPGAGKELFETTEQESIEIDYLVNNAGFGGYGAFSEREWDNDRDMIQVNITALTEITRFYLPGMIKRKRGAILNVASTAGLIPGPYQSVYYATKSYVISFSHAISHELKGTGVTVTALLPSATATEFAATGNLEETKLFSGKVDSAERVAAEGIRAMKKGKLIKINKASEGFALRYLVPFVPRKVALKISANLMENG